MLRPALAREGCSVRVGNAEVPRGKRGGVAWETRRQRVGTAAICRQIGMVLAANAFSLAANQGRDGGKTRPCADSGGQRGAQGAWLPYGGGNRTSAAADRMRQSHEA